MVLIKLIYFHQVKSWQPLLSLRATEDVGLRAFASLSAVYTGHLWDLEGENSVVLGSPSQGLGQMEGT